MTVPRHGIGTTPNIAKPCPTCAGTGEIRGAFSTYEGEAVNHAVCPKCNGTGEVVVMKGGTPRIMDNPDWKVKPDGADTP